MRLFFIIIFFFSISYILLTSCQKQELKKKYEGTYYFTTINYYWTITTTICDTIQYLGNIRAESKTTLEIQYAPGFPSLYPAVDKEGVLSYDSYVNQNNYFSGSFTEDGNINFIIGHSNKGGGTCRYVSGIKQ